MKAHLFIATHLGAAAMVVSRAVAADTTTVREASVQVVFTPAACEVLLHLAIDTGDPSCVEHRLMLGDAGRVPAFVVTGAVVGEADAIGGTARLPVSLTVPGRNEFEVRYRFVLPDACLDRCPLLVPAAPTDGIRRAVAIEVHLPDGARGLPGEFPGRRLHRLSRLDVHVPAQLFDTWHRRGGG